eukprot:gene4123-5159_t
MKGQSSTTTLRSNKSTNTSKDEAQSSSSSSTTTTTSPIFKHTEQGEITTPLTSFKRLTEGLHLRDLGLSPYAGSAFHQPPLVLLLFYPFHVYSEWLPPQLVFLICDLIIAILLRKITKMVWRVLPSEMTNPLSPESNLPNITAALYLFNPFTLFTSLSSYLTLYPIILIFPVALILKKHFFNSNDLSSSTPSTFPADEIASFLFYFRVFIVLCLSLSSLLYVSSLLFDSWEFIPKCYGFTLFVEDLTPNIEVFEHFRNFFLFIFQYHVFIYTIPLAIRLHPHPLFYFWILCAIIATFKSYPALGDTALHMSMLPLLHELLKGVRYSFIVVTVGIYVTVLAPILWQMWIYQGTGNANFYYTINLVFTLAQVLLIVDSISVLLKLDYVNKQKSLQQQQQQQQKDDNLKDN